jgi:RES domain-containing protein
MDLWRICRSKYEASAFAGSGAEKTGGRWNFKGHRLVYASENLSLAVLELFVHVAPEIMPADLISIRGRLPDSVSKEEIEESDLPGNWREYPAPAELQSFGTDWIKRQSSLVLIVPSAINPQEKNLLLNPAHPEIKKLKVEAGQPFRFDPRMFGK